MLVLTRKQEEAIVIAGTITVTILGVERNRVTVGITAPDDVKVLRKELLDANR